MLLAVEERENTDGRSLGELFYLGLDELPDLKYMEALRLVLQEFAEQLRAEYPSRSLAGRIALGTIPERSARSLDESLRAQKCA